MFVLQLKHPDISSRGPKILGSLSEAFGRIALPISSKLSFSFVAIVALMIALALTSVLELRLANERALQLINEQAKISALSEFRVRISETMFSGALLFAGTQGVAERDSSTEPLSTSLTWLQKIAGTNAAAAEQVSRYSGIEKADELLHRTNELVETGREVVGLYEAGQSEAARLLFDTALTRALWALDRDTVKLTFRSRVSMNSLVKSNEAAFKRSQKVVGLASVLAVFIALMLGYTASFSIVRPVSSIRTALRDVAQGDFSAKAHVSNGDELGELAERVNSTTEQLGEWHHSLESKVAEQVEIISRTNRLRRFLPKPVADQIIASGDDTHLLARHRAEIVVLFADLRGFTAFAETNEAEVVSGALNAFHNYVGPLIARYEGTLERFLGDGLVVLFNAPVKCSDPEARAVKLAMDIQLGFRPAMERFQGPVHRLGLGIGIAKGIASLGQIGFEGRLDYAAIGTVSNVASRLCDLASDTEVLASKDVADEVRGEFSNLELEPQRLKGLEQPIQYSKLSLKQ